MRLAAVVYSSDNIHWTRWALQHLVKTRTPGLTEIILVDNGSDPPYSVVDDGIFLPLADRIIRYDENIGGNAVFHRWMRDAWWVDPPEILAFLHCDLMVHEEAWDQRVLGAFDADPELSLLGFVGSNMIDASGGRGHGTMLNYRGEYFSGYGQASAAEVHGRRITGLEPAAVVDHAAMIFRRSALEQLTPQEGNYAPEHFYDRLLSCEVLERGEHIAILGIDVDHFSGGIGDGMAKADGLRRKWLTDEGIQFDPGDTYTAVYLESERRFFRKYHNNRFFPLWVNSDYSIGRPG